MMIQIILGKKNNLYLKLGLRYINEEPNPEMEGFSEHIVNMWGAFRKKYTSTRRGKSSFFKIN